MSGLVVVVGEVVTRYHDQTGDLGESIDLGREALKRLPSLRSV